MEEPVEYRAKSSPMVDVTTVSPLPTVKAAAHRGRFVFGYLPATRDLRVGKVAGPAAMDWATVLRGQNTHALFLQYLVNRRTAQAFAETEGNQEEAETTASWFVSLTEQLRLIFETPELELIMDRRDFRFKILFGDRPVDLDELPDGFSSLLSIIAELLLKEEAIRHSGSASDTPRGVVLIDEVETHLHLSLQEKVLPFLTTVFPTIQFIVATHSPLVISSLDDSVVHDLRDDQQALGRDYRGIRYGTLMTSHFHIATDFDLQSSRLLGRLAELHERERRSESEDAEYHALITELGSASAALGREVWKVTGHLAGSPGVERP